MKTYTNILLSIYFTGLLLLTGLGFYLQPLRGDLTRIGGFAENNFAGSKTEQVFAESLSDYDQYEHYYDVIVMGDSFSQNRQNGWQQWFANKTGLSITTLHVNKWSMNDLLEHPVFKAMPPKLLIYETAERNLEKMFVHNTANCTATSTTRPAEKIAINALQQETITRQVEEKNDSHIDYEQAVSFLRANYRQYIQRKPRSIQLELTSENLFSNAKADSLLVLSRDFTKLDWPSNTLDKSLCALKNMQYQVQNNGKTWFLSTIAPDKLTAYTPYIQTGAQLPLTLLAKIQAHDGLQYVDLLGPLQQAIGQHEQDVYFSNDSHWGEAGHRIAAAALLAFLTEQSIVAP
ncbi:MAG: hypothetical protein KBT88_03730 [Gammaproteobacteria bacterium]|nr:hypothetical protein [Gammaproteobacteria bacterium]MBQ0838872.1 hypothetical protein [Gammaproteobacteria bacterium]